MVLFADGFGKCGDVECVVGVEAVGVDDGFVARPWTFVARFDFAVGFLGFVVFDEAFEIDVIDVIAAASELNVGDVVHAFDDEIAVEGGWRRFEDEACVAFVVEDRILEVFVGGFIAWDRADDEGFARIEDEFTFVVARVGDAGLTHGEEVEAG